MMYLKKSFLHLNLLQHCLSRDCIRIQKNIGVLLFALRFRILSWKIHDPLLNAFPELLFQCSTLYGTLNEGSKGAGEAQKRLHLQLIFSKCKANS